jgi:two-component system alkaline phosphatase synthesis response regulator PhoP
VTGQAAAAHNGSRADRTKPARVLLVDDDPSIRRLCSYSLQSVGIEVLEAEDGQSGLEQARCERPDLVLMDVMMPGLDGFELAAALRGHESTRAIPFMFLSGESEQENGARAREFGALAYLTKPFSPTELAARVARVLAPSVEPAR